MLASVTLNPVEMQDISPVRQTMARVWAEMLPFTPMDETVAWRETGVDSLATLQFMVRLEQALTRPLSFDMFTLDMTVGEILAVIEFSQDLAAQAEPAPPAMLDLTLFIVPGLFGDEPILAEYRRALKNVVRFHTLTLPDMESPVGVLGSIPRTAEAVVRQIIDRQPEGPVHLCGYSIGGMIAFDAANQLLAAGREVRFLGLLDSLIGDKYAEMSKDDPAQQRAEEPPKSLLSLFGRRGKEDLPTYAERLTYGLIMGLGRFELGRRWILKYAHRHDHDTNEGRRLRLLRTLRGQAMFLWRPKPCPAPTLLVASDDHERFFSIEPWQKLCPNLTVQRVLGRHKEIFNPPALAKLIPAMTAMLGADAAQTAAS